MDICSTITGVAKKVVISRPKSNPFKEVEFFMLRETMIWKGDPPHQGSGIISVMQIVENYQTQIPIGTPRRRCLTEALVSCQVHQRILDPVIS